MTMELKPCPFCGGNINEQRDKGFRSDIGAAYWVRCQTCRAEGPTALHGTNQASELWNTRATDPHICSLCGNDEKVARLGRMLGLRPDVAFMKLNRANMLLKEMAEALGEIVNEAKGYESRHGKFVSWRERGEQIIQKYREQEKK